MSLSLSLSYYESQLYDDSWEHQRMIESEKIAYTGLSRPQQCIRLVQYCKRAFDYNSTLPFVYDPIEQAWVIILWEPRVCPIPILPDQLIAITFPLSPITSSIFSMQVVATSLHKDHPPDIVITSTDGIELPVDVSGLPLVAMQYTRIRILVRSKSDPGPIVCRFRILPDDLRYMMAISRHTITGFLCKYNVVSSHKLYVASGMVFDKPISCCCIM
jgi:hypothetical protein